MDKIRQRLDEYEKQDKDYGVILDFLFPIIEFGSSEEKRINEAYNKDNKDNKDNTL